MKIDKEYSRLQFSPVIAWFIVSLFAAITAFIIGDKLVSDSDEIVRYSIDLFITIILVSISLVQFVKHWKKWNSS